MRVTKSLIPTSRTQDQIDDLMNRLLVDVQDFSRIACLEGRAYGVEIFNEHCETIDINMCMRSRIVEGLISAQETTERYLGFGITPQYEEVQIYNDKWIGRTQLKRGIESVNLVQQTTSIDGFDPQTINYWVTSGTVVEDIPNDYMYVEFDRDLVWNIDDVIIRDSDGIRVNLDDTQSNYIMIVGDNWRLILDKPYIVGSGLDGTTLYAQDSHFMQVTITPPTLENDGVLYPVYPNSNQIIPCAREAEDISGDLRYWFHPWVLVDERRLTDTDIDLESGQFYKLLQEIEFKEFYEIAQSPQAVYLDGEGIYQTVSSDNILVDIIDAPKGIVSINLSNWIKEDCPENFWKFSHVILAYKTNPEVIGFDGEEMTVSIAIANLVAAELPMSQCQCKIDKGFIAKAQESYGELRINQITGEEKRNIRYGDKVGQKIYFDYIDRVPKLRKRVRA